MFNWVYRKSDNVFQFGGPYDPTFDPSTQGILALPEHPDPILHRYDGAGGVRQATAQDLLDAAAADKDIRAGRIPDEIKALLFFVADNLPTPIPHATARAGYKTILKGLL